MRNKLFGIVLFLTVLTPHIVLATSPIPLPSQRQTLSLDGTWIMTFQGNAVPVAVPGNIPFTFGETTWRRTFKLALNFRPAAAFIDFDGIVNQGTARLNGTELGPLYGFTATRFNVAPLLRLDGDNELVVTLDDRLTESSVPGGATSVFLAGSGPIAYTFPVAWANRPGIIRNVRLTYTASGVISDMGVVQKFGQGLDEVELQIRGTIAGRLGFFGRVDVDIREDAKSVGGCFALVTQDGNFQCTYLMRQPRLWSPDSPALYNVHLTLSSSLGTDLDIAYDRIGIRKFEALGPRFYLNNKPVFLRGIARHDIYGERGFVADEATIRRDLGLIKALGANFLRCIHYPHHELVAKVADEIGLLVSEELPAWAVLGHPQVQETGAAMMASLVRRDFNRPSVVMYFAGSVNTDRGEAYMRRVISTANAIDPSRLVSFVYDDANFTPQRIADNSRFAGSVGASFYAQNTYWFSDIFQSVMPSVPTERPMLSTEWTGSEGSNRGPLGDGPTDAFPSLRDEGFGFPETFQAQKLAESALGFSPFACSDRRPQQCLAGVVYFNFQDVEWPGMPVFYKNHKPIARNGLVYEDRVLKVWPAVMFRYMMWTLP